MLCVLTREEETAVLFRPRAITKLMKNLSTERVSFPPIADFQHADPISCSISMSLNHLTCEADLCSYICNTQDTCDE